MPFPNCVICDKEALGVCSSLMGPVSHAYCKECIEAGREDWSTLVGGLYGCREDSVAEWVLPIIKATCEFYNRTESQLWIDVKKLERDYDNYCRSGESTSKPESTNEDY